VTEGEHGAEIARRVRPTDAAWQAAALNRRYLASIAIPNWRAAVDETGQYCFAVALWCRSPPRAPIGKSATACDFTLRLMGGSLQISLDRSSCP